jgi:hypothetical protein
MGKKKPETASQMLETLNEFMLGPEPDFKTMTTEQVAEYLKKNKLDANQVFAATRALLKETRGQMELARARKRRFRVEESLPLGERLRGTRMTLLEQIRALAGSRAAAVYARKLEDSPDADLRSLLEDFEFLDQLDLSDDE